MLLFYTEYVEIFLKIVDYVKIHKIKEYYVIEISRLENKKLVLEIKISKGNLYSEEIMKLFEIQMLYIM